MDLALLSSIDFIFNIYFAELKNLAFWVVYRHLLYLVNPRITNLLVTFTVIHYYTLAQCDFPEVL